MRIKAAVLTFNKLKHFREMQDLDYHAFQTVMEHAKIAVHIEGEKIADISHNDPYAYFLLQGAVRLGNGLFQTQAITASSETAQAMLNHRLPKGGFIQAKENDTVLLIIRRRYINEARLDYSKPAQSNANSFGITGEDLNQQVSDSLEQDWMSTLLSSPLFSRISPNNLQRLLLSLEEKPFKQGETIISSGQQDKYFYIIKSGQVEVLPNIKRTSAIKLGPGQFFGEGAITGDTVHSATVKMLKDGIVCLVHISQFNKLLKESLFEFANTEQLEQLLYSDSNPAIVLDVRFSIEYKNGHRKNSINVPINKLRDNLEHELSKDIMYLIDYGEDKRSQVAALILIENDFSVLLINEE